MSYEAVEILMNRKTAYEMSILGSSSPVTSQPTNSIFRISETEDLRQTYECEQKACGCGPTYTVDLTKTRLIQTRQDHLCGCQTDRSDSMIFLSDISYIETNPKCVSFDSCPGGESTCYLLVMCPCLIPFCWIRSCFLKHTVNPIAISGAFGSCVFNFSQFEVLDALANIPAEATSQRSPKNPVQFHASSYQHRGTMSSVF